MKILVAVKRVPDYQVKVKVKPDGSGVDTEKWIVNPFDEIAVEEALKIKEAGLATEVVVVSIGSAQAEQQLRYAMAMGADSSILVTTENWIDSDLASKVLAEIYKKADYGLVIMGKQSIDSDSSQTGQLLSTRLGIPQGCFASKVEIKDGHAHVTREVDGGLETVKVSMPCVVTTDLRLNQPRYAPLPGIMKAKKKPLEIIPFESLGIPYEPKVKVKKMELPKKRSAGRKVGSVEELVKALKEEAKVL